MQFLLEVKRLHFIIGIKRTKYMVKIKINIANDTNL